MRVSVNAKCFAAEVDVYVVDAQVYDDVSRAIQSAIRDLGHIDILVHNFWGLPLTTADRYRLAWLQERLPDFGRSPSTMFSKWLAPT